MHGVFLHRPLKVIVCTITLVAFIVTTVAQDFAWATISAPVTTTPGVVVKVSIPESLGTVRDSWSDPRSPVPGPRIIHIQDAHCNYYAQSKIAEIIEYLADKYGVDTVNLEGGAKGYDLSIFTAIDDRAKRRRISDHFVKEGFVNGAEYYAVNNPGKVTLWGIEDTKLYIDNLRTYRESLQHKVEIDKDIKTLDHILTNLKRKIYSKELLEIDQRYVGYKAGSVEFKEYIGYLVSIASAKFVDVKKFPNLDLLGKTVSAEKSIDFKKANAEREELVNKLQKVVSKRELEELVVKTIEFKTGNIAQGAFHRYLFNKARELHIDIAGFPELKKFLAYTIFYESVDKSKIDAELSELESRIKETIFRTQEERSLDKLSKTLALTKNLFDIALTREDYKYYKDNLSSFDVRNYTSFIDRYAPLYNIQARPDSNIDRLDDYREAMAKFYEYSLKRDQAFVKNMRFTQNAERRTKAGYLY